ncbi:hypothetical protein F2Q70_00036930 [Brassica cretica]|uniref:Uncharacterized protein n=1 Tax=Brassica cretica TaxID=69181 RepID=A0A8S9JT47_BRACR|nr:hypothetical protein F2Q70_00036930 [Brassica cretica]
MKNRNKIAGRIRDVNQVYPFRSVPYCSGLVVERITAGLSRADCGHQNTGSNPYRRIYWPSRTVPRDAFADRPAGRLRGPSRGTPPYQIACYSFFHECSSRKVV